MILYMGSMVALFGNFFLQVFDIAFELFGKISIEALHLLTSISVLSLIVDAAICAVSALHRVRYVWCN